jgi:branched-chain amino acid transport system ATP-binding protein
MPEAALLKPVLLKTAELNAWYGESHVLHGVDFEVGEGELVTLLGRNGAGKTTILKSIMGIVGQRRGSVSFAGHELVGLPSNRIARLGVGYCPEERGKSAIARRADRGPGAGHRPADRRGPADAEGERVHDPVG